jgi:hypothetical protein
LSRKNPSLRIIRSEEMTRRLLLGLGASFMASALFGCGGETQPEPVATDSPTAGEDASKKMMGMMGNPVEQAKGKAKAK